MRAVCYLRIAKKRRAQYGKSPFLFEVTASQSNAPIYSGSEPLPTVTLKLNLDMPADAFGPNAEVTVDVPAGALKVLGVTG